MIQFINKIIIACVLLLPHNVFATEEYQLTVTMPISQAGGQVELKQVTYTTYYSPLETRVSAVTWDPCKANNQSADCDLVNPLNKTRLEISIQAFNAESIHHIDTCYVAFDFTRYQPLTDELRQALGKDNPGAKLLRLAVQSVEQNTQGSADYIDCEFRLKGQEIPDEFKTFELPKYLHPIIADCQPTTPEAHNKAITLNDQGMEHYKTKNWEQAIEHFKRAAEQDCNYLMAHTNMASVLALQGQYPQARAVLWRAYQINPELTLKKLKTDPDYSKLKRDTNFYAASSAIGMSYRRYCYAPQAPADINPALPELIKQSKVNKWNKQYAVATAYAYKSDFNKNGIADWVYPLVNARLDSVLVVFDDNQLNPTACTSTPLQRADISKANRGDPCKTKIFTGRQGSSRGIRLETESSGVNRMVCR